MMAINTDFVWAAFVIAASLMLLRIVIRLEKLLPSGIMLILLTMILAAVLHVLAWVFGVIRA